MELHALIMELCGPSMINALNSTSIILSNIWKRLLVFIQNYRYPLLLGHVKMKAFVTHDRFGSATEIIKTTRSY